MNWNKKLKQLIEKDRNTKKHLKNPKMFYKHSVGVSNLSYLVSCAFDYCGIDVNVKLTQSAGLLHDIGKIVANEDEFKKDPELLLDGLYGSRYLEKRKMPEIASIIRTSFTSHELIPYISDENPDNFIPKKNEQKIVVYSDMHTSGTGNYVSFKERIMDLKNRYDEKSLLIKSLKSGGEIRLRNLNEEIENKMNISFSNLKK